MIGNGRSGAKVYILGRRQDVLEQAVKEHSKVRLQVSLFGPHIKVHRTRTSGMLMRTTGTGLCCPH